jgi:hypothetical protein
VLALLAQVDLPSLGRKGPEDLRRVLAVFFTLMGVGFVVGIMGHLFKSRTLVIVGLGLIFIATAFFLVAIAQEG